MSDTPEALVAEFERREKRALAVVAVRERLEAARAEAEAQSAAAATVVAALSVRAGQLQGLRDRLESEHAEALTPSPEEIAAAADLAEAVARTRAAPIDDDAASTAAATAQAAAEDRLTAANQRDQARIRPLVLRLQSAIEQAGKAEHEADAAETARSDAVNAARIACIDLLRLKRDAAALALDEATFDLAVAGGAHYTEGQITLGESRDLMAELGLKVDVYFGTASRWRAQQVGRQDPALLLDQARPAASDHPTARRTGRKGAALLAA